MPRQKNRNGIPDRWLDYQNVGKRIPGTRFISFKVPLKNALSHSLTESEVFGPWELMDTLAEQEEELGLIIDLTFTTRYYDVEDIPESLLCLKIFTMGHEVPSDATILNFKQAVNNFLQNNKDNDKLIGVHCTHGLNRTGYLVCRYLIDVDEVEPKKAIELFNSARGHKIERANYLQDLKSGPKRSNTGMMTCALEERRGRAACRPPASRAERPPDGDARSSRFPQTGWSQGSPGWSPQVPHHSHPRPTAPYQAPRPQARWGPPHPDAQCRQPFYMEQRSRPCHPQPEPAWDPAPHHNPRRGRDHQDPRDQRRQRDQRDNRDQRGNRDQRHQQNQWDNRNQRHQQDQRDQWGHRDQRHAPASRSFHSDWTRPPRPDGPNRGFYFDEETNVRQTVVFRHNYK